MPALFGTNGIRGPAETLFTKDFCTRLGYVFGTWLSSKKKQGYVAVAMDPRQSSPRIKSHLLQGLAAAGWEILDQGVVPTPALTYFVKNSPQVGGGVMVTGSHIAEGLNGVKLFIDGEEVTKAHEAEIEDLFTATQLPLPASSPIVQKEDKARDMYLAMLTQLADLPYPKLKIVVDTANGTQSQIVRDLFASLQLDVVCFGDCDIQSPYFVPRDTETSSAFTELTRQVLLHQADLGIGFDMDGDRVIFIDDTGRYLPGDYSCSLIARDSASDSLVTPISSSSVVDQLDKKVYRTKVGATYVIAKMKEVGATFGFEANGGGISSEIFYGRDGASTAVKMLNLIKRRKQRLSALYDSLPKYYLFRDKLACPTEKYPHIYEAVARKYSGKDIDDLDGLKVHLTPDDWILFRASGNAPEFRVFTQSRDDKQAQKLGADGLDFVQSLLRPAPATTITSSSATPIDSLHILDSITALPDQCRQVIADTAAIHIPPSCQSVDHIVISGMGGSALGGRILAGLGRDSLRVPLVVSTQYHLPAFVGPKTLVVASSYSGNTEETLSSLEEARARRAQIFIVASGGKLAEIAKQANLPSYIFDPLHNPSHQPRLGLGYNILALVTLLSRCQLIQPPANLDHLPDFLASRQPQHQVALQDLAHRLINKIIVILASEHLLGAAHALRNQLHENAKTFSALFDLPEANHHLLEGLTLPHSNPAHLALLFIDSPQYHPETRRRYPLTAQVAAKQHLPVFTFTPAGDTPLFAALDLVQAGAYLAYYLSQLNSIDPGPIPWVDWFKDEIAKTV